MFQRVTNSVPYLVHVTCLTLLFGIVGCGGENAEPVDQSCGGHGEFHGDHCDCDAGYTSSEDGLSCVPVQTSNDDSADTSDAVEGEVTDLVFNPSTGQGSVG